MLHGGALGDGLLAFHLMRRMVRDPHQNLMIVARHPVYRWLAQCGQIAASAIADDCGVTTLYSDQPRLSAELGGWLADCNLVVNMIDSPGGVVERNLAGATAGQVISIDPRPDGSSRHIVDQWASQLTCRISKRQIDSIPQGLVQAEGIQPPSIRSRCKPLNPVGDATGPMPVKVIVHPGSGGLKKCAPIHWFEAIVAKALRLDCQTAWMIGPDETERNGATLQDRLQPSAPVIMEPDICHAAERLAGADVFVGNDSGMAHLAALCGVRTVVWFGPTDPEVWRPIGSDVHVNRDTDQDSYVDRVMRWVVSTDRRTE